MADYQTDILIVGGETGGCAAALGACSFHLHVIMTEETDWIGGQLTSQAVPPDEHSLIETRGATSRYREFRNRIRQYYRDHYPLRERAAKDPFFQSWQGSVSDLCFEPRIGVKVLEDMMLPHIASRQLKILFHLQPVAVETQMDKIYTVTLQDTSSGNYIHIQAHYILDATELGTFYHYQERNTSAVRNPSRKQENRMLFPA